MAMFGHRFGGRVSFALGLFWLVPAGASPLGALPAPSASAVRVTVEQGVVEGRASTSGTVFAGLPYASPPVGPLRWAAPSPPAHWNGVRSAGSLPPGCPQNAPLAGFAAPSASEDCLYLTVYTPPGRLRGDRPVMVWFPGGGLFAGAGRDYDGRALARLGDVIVVTVDYRLGALGFLALSGLADRGEANLGMLDQRQALRWIARNIASFGGDPRRVTIFGQSAGADSVLVQLLDPAARGLFQRAIVQSAGFRMKIEPLPAARKAAAGFAAALGCAETDLACLRAKPVDAVLAKQAPFLGGPIVDGKVLAADPIALVRAGRFNRVPIMIGTTSDEFLWYVAVSGALHRPGDGWTPRLLFDKDLGDRADAIAAAYGMLPGADADPAIPRALGDGLFACPAQAIAAGAAAHVPVYLYEFGDTTAPAYTLTPGYDHGAGHTAELPYLFPGFHGGSGRPVTLDATQQDLSRQMIASWARFARDGEIGRGVGVAARSDWPRYRQGGSALLIGAGGDDRLVEPLQRHRCALWATPPTAGS